MGSLGKSADEHCVCIAVSPLHGNLSGPHLLFLPRSLILLVLPSPNSVFRRFACFALRQTIQTWLSHSFAARRSMTVPCKSLCGLVPAPDLTGFISWLRQARQSGKMTPDDVSTIVFLVAQQETRQIDGRFVVVIVRRMTLSKRTRGQEHLLGQHVA